MKKIFFLLIPLISTFFVSCEDVVSISVQEGKEQLVIDAWITDEAKVQKILLTVSQPYFDNSKPKPALGARVYIEKSDKSRLEFKDEKNSGEYTYNATRSDFIKEGEQVTLHVLYNSEEYISTAKSNRVPKIDSLVYEESSEPFGPPREGRPTEGFVAQFYARDPIGPGDTYVVRKYINDTLQAKPDEFQLAYDAAFTPGSKSDGLIFIQPVRQSINNGFFKANETIRVELYSINNDVYYFLQQVQTQSANGGIFATPLENIPTNVFNINNQSSNKPLGVFILSKISVFSTLIDPKKAKKKK
ncbi:MAG: DUF4249 family protein [Leadbetterella sp.]